MSSPATPSTPERFVRSTLASYWSLGVRLVVSFAVRMAIARLLLKEEVGLYELALRIVTIGGASLRDVGLVFQLMRDERKPYGTVLAWTATSGAVVTVALMLGAPLLAILSPELPAVLRVYALWVFLDGLVAVPRTFFERELNIGRLVGPEITRGLATAAVAVFLAAFGWGVWSLILADLAATAIFAALVWWRAWGKIPLEVDWSLLPSLLRRSNLLFFIWLLYQMVTYSDSFVVKSFESLAVVGAYAYAYLLAFLTRQIVFPRALVPALVAYRDDGPRFTQAFRVGMIFLMTCEVAAGYFLYFNAPLVVRIFCGEGWDSVVPLLRVLCFVPFLDIFSELGGEVLKIRHEDRLWLLIVALNLASLLGFGIHLTSQHGALGMAYANFLLVGNLLMAVRMAMLFGRALTSLAVDMVWIYLAPLVLLGAAAWLLPGGGWPLLFASVLALLLTLSLLGLRFWPLIRAFLATRGEATP